MPLGDPQGGLFEYTSEGLPENIKAVTIHVSDVNAAVRFYNGIMKMDTVSESNEEAVLSLGNAFIILRKKEGKGTDTGLYLGVHDPFEFHRRMVDDGVVFITHPQRGPLGVWASFRDPDGNVIRIVEKEMARR